MKVRIDTTRSPNAEDIQAILTPLRAHNTALAGEAGAQPFALLIRDEDTNIALGGLHAKVFYRWMFIELLAVPEQARGQGLGSRLMAMAEDLAREMNCIGIWLDTFDFQAPEFYRRLGFSEFGQIEDHPLGHRRFFMQKRLQPGDAELHPAEAGSSSERSD
jgi:GNAT superfamily N-acetyltransferase